MPPLATMIAAPPTPERIVAPKGHRTAMKNAAWNAPKMALPARRPIRMPVRVVGASRSRSKKPFWMSVAIAAAPVTEPNNTPCTIVAASENWRNESTSGNPGRLVAPLNEDAPSAAKKIGNTMLGATSAGCRKVSFVERFAIATVWRTALRVPRGASDETVSTVVIVTTCRPRGGDPWPPRTRRRGSVR